MYKHLLDQEAEKVLSLFVVRACHDRIEVVHYLSDKLLVERRKLKFLASGLQFLLLGLKLRYLDIQFLDLLVADLGLEPVFLERLEVLVYPCLSLDCPVFDGAYLLIDVRLLGHKQAVRLLPNPCNELLVAEDGLHVLDD